MQPCKCNSHRDIVRARERLESWNLKTKRQCSLFSARTVRRTAGLHLNRILSIAFAGCRLAGILRFAVRLLPADWLRVLGSRNEQTQPVINYYSSVFNYFVIESSHLQMPTLPPYRARRAASYGLGRIVWEYIRHFK